MTRFAIPAALALLLGLFVAAPAATAAEPAAYACRQDIHPQDEDFPGVHVATLEEAPNGDLLYGFYAGSREGADDVKTYMGRLAAGAATWTAPTVVFDEPNQPDGNAVFWTDDEHGLVHLLFSTIRGDGWTEADLRMISSADNGQTWSDPQFIREEWGWLFGTLPFRMSNGELIVPIYSETEWSSGFYISSDDAQTFTPYPNDDDTTWPTSLGGMIQPATVELEAGHLLALNRSRDGFIWQTESTDFGRTWSDAEPTTMPNNNSRLALLKLHNGNLVLAHNPTMFGRSPLRLSLSTDGGQSWSASVDIENESGEEFSYPYLLQTSDGMIQLGYTHRRESMRHLAFNEQFIVEGADIPSNPDPAVKAEFADGELAEVTTCRYAVNPQMATPVACPEGAVPSPGYGDVAGNVHEPSIACVSWHDIALGTDDDSYSPARHVNRAQMASFLARLIERAGGELPAAPGGRFTDVDDSNVHADRIEQLAEAGIVSGTTETTYDPEGDVTRAQMATFLVRSYEFVTEQSVPGSRDHFTDDDGNDHEDSINRAVSAGFAAGFGDGAYRPGASTRRDQMATYLTNTLERLARDGRVEPE
jgi:hypothetical protein